jgi:hypothetical protein
MYSTFTIHKLWKILSPILPYKTPLNIILFWSLQRHYITASQIKYYHTFVHFLLFTKYQIKYNWKYCANKKDYNINMWRRIPFHHLHRDSLINDW